MDQIPYPGPPMLFHVRSNVLITTLWLFDVLMLAFALDRIVLGRVGYMILFSSEVRDVRQFPNIKQADLCLPLHSSPFLQPTC